MEDNNALYTVSVKTFQVNKFANTKLAGEFVS